MHHTHPCDEWICRNLVRLLLSPKLEEQYVCLSYFYLISGVIDSFQCKFIEFLTINRKRPAINY